MRRTTEQWADIPVFEYGRQALDTLEQQINDVLDTGREVGLQTIKACCQERYRSQAEPALAEMVKTGLVIEIRKHRYQKVINGNTK